MLLWLSLSHSRLCDELEGKIHPWWVKTSTDLQDEQRPPGWFQNLLKEHVQKYPQAAWKERKGCLDQQIWSNNLVFVSSLNNCTTLSSSWGSLFSSHDLLSVFLLCFYELSVLLSAVALMSLPSSFMSLAALEKLPLPTVMALQKVTQQLLPSATNQSQIAINFYSYAYVWTLPCDVGGR